MEKILLGIVAIIRRLFVRLIVGPYEIQAYKVSLDGDMTLEEAIDAGNYDVIGGVDESNFPSGSIAVKSGEIEVFIVKFLHIKTNKEVIAALALLNLKPSSLFELLAFGATYPEVQREGLLVGLGSQYQLLNDSFVPYLNVCHHVHNDERELGVTWGGANIHLPTYSRFLASKK